MGEQVEVISWLFRLLFISIGLHVLAAGIILLLGRRVPGIQQRDAVKVSTGIAKIVGNTRLLGVVWMFIGMLGLFFGVMSLAGR
ncbi:hypothetical protein [Streptomyces sp. NPDC055186]